MSADLIRFIQGRLTVHGLKVHEDGMYGAETQEALRVFQRQKALRQTGTLTAETVTALRTQPGSPVVTPPPRLEMRPLWLAEFERRKGLHEVRDNSLLRRWLGSDGRTLGDPAKLPWCGDAIQTAIALTLPSEPQLANPYLARNWLQFGKRVPPRVGAIMVFWRGRRDATDGHVALYLGEDRDTYTVLGGNQRNAIIEAPIAKNRFLGARWPLTDTTETFAVQRAVNAPLSTNEA